MKRREEARRWSAGGLSLQLSILCVLFVLWMRGGFRRDSSWCYRNAQHLLHGKSPSCPPHVQFRTQARMRLSTTDVILPDGAFRSLPSVSKPRVSRTCQILCSCFHQSIKFTWPFFFSLTAVDPFWNQRVFLVQTPTPIPQFFIRALCCKLTLRNICPACETRILL